MVNADWGYSDVTIAKGKITLNQATRFVGGITLDRKTATTVNLKNVVRRAALVI